MNLYDLSPANDFLYPIGMGIHHAGVEVLGTEYSFASNAGIFDATPKEAPGAKFREQIFMGVLDGGQAEIKMALDDLRSSFGPNDYNIIHKNCNHFASALCRKLVGVPIPGYVNRIAEVGACCACLLPRQMLENAPVGDPDANANNPSGGNSFGMSGAVAPQAQSIRAFSGTGSKLGGASTSSSSEESTGLVGSLLGKAGIGGSSGTSGSSKGTDDLTDRREKARKAALARLEKQNQVSSESKDK